MTTPQIAFSFEKAVDYSPESFLPMPSNREALQAISNFPSKEGEVLVLYGPKGVGKTHLLHIWQQKSGDRYYKASELAQVPFNVRKVAVDDLQEASSKVQENLFFLFNHIISSGGAFLISSEKPVAQMELIPELKSRLLTARQVEITVPEEAQLEVLLVKQAADLQLPLEPVVVKYLMSRAERSPKVLQEMLLKLDTLSLEQKRKITVPLLKEVLEQSK